MKKKGLIAVLSFASVGLLACGLVGCAQKDDELAYGEWVTTVEATCEEQGVQVRVCLTDPDKVQERFIPATGHDWNEWQTLTPATCLTEGSQTRSCKTCENSDFQSVRPLGHEWGEWETGKAPTCRVAGYETRVCLRDEKHTENNPIDALGHDWSDWIVTTAPTCEELGEKTRYCRNDNAHTENMTASRLYHSWDEWVVTKAPTESEDGEETRTCRHDNEHVETRVSYALGSEGLRYTLINNKTQYSVSDFSSASETVVIPAMHDGLPVTRISGLAFSSCSRLKTVAFAKGSKIEKVDAYTFSDCVSLESFDFPEGVEMIASGVFRGCTSLKSISIPASVTELGHYNSPSICGYCPMLESITIAEGNKFYRCENNCVIEIATQKVIMGAKNCIIPQSAKEIALRSFIGMGIENLYVPASVETIGNQAFQSCTALKSVTFEEGSLRLGAAIGTQTFYECTSLETIVLSENVEEIGYKAFYGCSALREVVFLGDKIEAIVNYGTFGACDKLTAFVLPASVTFISATAFTSATIANMKIAPENPVYVKDGACVIERETNKLVASSVDSLIPDYVTSIGRCAFAYKEIQTLFIPKNVTTIERKAFYQCKNLKKVTCENESRLQTIEESAFEDCYALVSVSLSAFHLRSIGNRAFYMCSKLDSLLFETRGIRDEKNDLLLNLNGACDLEEIGKGAFAYTSLKSFSVCTNVKSLGENIFLGCKQLKTIVVSEKNETFRAENNRLIRNDTNEEVELSLSEGVTIKTGPTEYYAVGGML